MTHRDTSKGNTCSGPSLGREGSNTRALLHIQDKCYHSGKDTVLLLPTTDPICLWNSDGVQKGNPEDCSSSFRTEMTETIQLTGGVQ